MARFGTIAIAMAILFGGCTHVAPYQRETLADRTMDVGAQERMETQFRSHVYDAREGAMGASGSTGGGCGCN
jgi:hypothetical protein